MVFLGLVVSNLYIQSVSLYLGYICAQAVSCTYARDGKHEGKQ